MNKKILLLIFISIFLINISFAQLNNDLKIFYNHDHNNISGDILIDISGNEQNSTCVNMASNCGLTNGIIINGSNLDGNNDYINMGDQDIISNNFFTVNMWVKGTVETGRIWSEGSTASNTPFTATNFNTGGIMTWTYRNDASSLVNVDSTSSINDGEWHMVTIVRNNAVTAVYIDGINENNGTISGTFSTTTTTIGALRQASISGYADIDVDEFGYWNKSLTNNDISELFNEGIGNTYPFIIESLNINITYPTNNLHSKGVNQLINYSINYTGNNLLDCDMIINNTINISNNSINYTSNNYIENYLDFEEGIYDIYINCTDNTIYSTSNNINLTIDKTNPLWTINSINTDNTSIFDRGLINNIYFNDTLEDTYLFSYNVTVYYPNNDVWFSNQTINLNTSLFNYIRNESINISQPNGTYTINYYAEDDHTAKKIPNYDYGISPDSYNFFFENYYIEIKSENPTSIQSLNTTKLIDRYTFDINYKTPSKIRTFSIYSNKKIYYRNNLYDFPVFVIGKNWVDFNTNITGTTYKVIKKTDNWYQIEITTIDPLSVLNIKSLGGLNIVNETYTFQIKENKAPNITNTTPNSPIQTFDGVYLNFTTIATDEDNDTLTYNYYYNGELNHTGQNLTNFFVPFNSHGLNNMTVIVSDGGKTTNYTWIINITHNPVGATVTNLQRNPLTTWYSNIEASFICTGIDNDNETSIENMSAEIEYRTGILWNSLTVTNNNDTTFTAPINLTSLQGESIDVRCRITDFDYGFTPWYTINDIVTVEEAYYPVGNITRLTPEKGIRNYVTPVTCSTDSFGSIRSYKIIYDIDAYYNGIWHNISEGLFNKALFDMSKISYGENVSFRCRAKDGLTTTDYYTGGNVQRQHINNIFMYSKGQDEIMQRNKPYHKGLLVDFYNEPNITIKSSFVDCNSDGYWDYYYEYNNTRNTTREDFICINTKGVIKHTIGVFIEKTGTNNLFCGTKTNGLCRIERTYDVIVR